MISTRQIVLKMVPTLVVAADIAVSSVSESAGAKLPMNTPPLDKADNGRLVLLDEGNTPGSHGYWSLGFKIPVKNCTYFSILQIYLSFF